jgi:hypothetical protein
MRSLHRLAAALALLAAPCFAMAITVRPADLPCQFKASRDAGGQVRLQFSLRNAGARDLQLLRWGSPFEGGWFGPFVRVSTAQGDLPFEGALRKRGDPSAQDYLLLRAGQTLQAEQSLNDAYTLPPGPLTLRAAWHWHDVMAEGTPPRPRSRHQGLDQDCGNVSLGH